MNRVAVSFLAICFVPALRAGVLPAAFEVNVGQSAPEVKFLSRGTRYALFATDREIVLSLASLPAHPVRMRLPRRSRPEGIVQLDGKTNYLGGKQPFRNVSNYARIRYPSAAPGIDLVLRYGKGHMFEYDWVVAPGADPNRIRFSFEGADDLRVDSNGDLVLRAGSSELRHCKPLVYQERNGVRETIPGGFRLIGKRTVGFQVAKHDKAQPLVIDPAVVYALGTGEQGSYLPPIEGGTQLDKVMGVAVDAAGNAFITGNTYSPVYPGALPPPEPYPNLTFPYPYRMFVAKIKPDGSQFAYVTLFEEGGATAIAIDSAGSAYITGGAGANISMAPVSLRLGNGELFVAKLDPSGSFLQYNAYIGGSQYASASAIAIDGLGNAYIAGATQSSDYPVTPGAFEPANNPPMFASTGFVTKLNATGTALVYSTYLGGKMHAGNPPAYDQVNAIAVDPTGYAYVAGQTESVDFPVTPGAFQTILPGFSQAFVTKLTPDGSALVYSTFLAGDRVNGIAIDGAGNAYLTGMTTSSNFPVTSAAFQPKFNGASGETNAFVTKLNASGSGLVYSTYFGAGGAVGHAIAVDAAGNAYFTGETLDGLPVLDAVQSNFYGGTCYVYTGSGTSPYASFPCTDAFVAALNPAGSALLFSTYLNGYAIDQGLGIALDPQGGIYVAGTGELSLAAANPLSSPGAAFIVKLNPNGANLHATSQSITNAASFVSGLVEPGGLATVFITGLTGIDGAVKAMSLPLPYELSGVSVSLRLPPQFPDTAGDEMRAPLLAVADVNGQQQINFQVPSGIGNVQAADVVIRQNGNVTVVTQVGILATPPGVFKVDATHGAIQHGADYSLVTPSHPAAKGEIVLVYATGLGAVTPSVEDGAPAPNSPVSTTNTIPTVAIGAQPAEVRFSGLTPGTVGLYQLNVRVPQNSPSGDVDLVVSLPPVTVLDSHFNLVTVPRDSQAVKISVQ
jgi:uncharacterized protein (TIGR03437 family)